MGNEGFDGNTLQMFNTTSMELEAKFSILDLFSKQQRPKKYNKYRYFFVQRYVNYYCWKMYEYDESANIQTV